MDVAKKTTLWTALCISLLSCNSSDSELDVGTDSGVEVATHTGSDTDGDGDAVALGSWPDDKYITIDEVYARTQADDPDMLLINVVDETFYNLGHIEGSLQITWDTLEANLDLVTSTKRVVVYCRKGVRSESAYTTLMDHDFPWVWVMEGGIEAWTAGGYPTVPD